MSRDDIGGSLPGTKTGWNDIIILLSASVLGSVLFAIVYNTSSSNPQKNPYLQMGKQRHPKSWKSIKSPLELWANPHGAIFFFFWICLTKVPSMWFDWFSLLLFCSLKCGVSTPQKEGRLHPRPHVATSRDIPIISITIRHFIFCKNHLHLWLYLIHTMNCEGLSNAIIPIL